MDELKERLLNEAIKTGFELTRENRKLKEEVALWHNLFDELLKYHFAHGGDAPNLRFDRIVRTDAPDERFYELLNNNDYVTAVRRRR